MTQQDICTSLLFVIFVKPPLHTPHAIRLFCQVATDSLGATLFLFSRWHHNPHFHRRRIRASFVVSVNVGGLCRRVTFPLVRQDFGGYPARGRWQLLNSQRCT